MKKIILITGSTDGIGKLVAIKLAKQGHSLYVHGRDSEKLTTTISEIKAITQNENISGVIADFSSFDSLSQMVDQINRDVQKIDILINNAGIFKSAQSHNKAGFDMRIAVNYLAPYVLTEELLPLLKKGTDSRIINLSSAAQSCVSHDALSGKENLSQSEAYAQSKLALTMWSFYLAKMLQDISVIAVNPGSLLNTKMAAEAYGQYWSSADKGADILYDLAVSQDYEGVTGKYFDNDKGSFGPAHPDAYSETKIDTLINTTKVLIDRGFK